MPLYVPAGAGGVTGPGSSTSGDLVTFNGTGGNVIQDSAAAISTDTTFASNSDAKIPTEKAGKAYMDARSAGQTPNHVCATVNGGATTAFASNFLYSMKLVIYGTPTITGIAFHTPTGSGNMKGALYNSTGGTQLAVRSTSFTCGSSGTYNLMAFDSTYAVTAPGIYIVSIIADNSTATIQMGLNPYGSSAVNQGAFTVPSTVSNPSRENSSRPVLALY